ncbi:hypothetical protein AX16_009449 [Volvariella volvacea WC 439]|nr:hypothetical protein AX16_009449 [Volvariella volvacea WC 439]
MGIAPPADNISSMQPNARTKLNSRLLNTSDRFRMRVFAITIPTGHYGCVTPHSSLTFKSGVTAFGGTIDADYCGELKVLLRNDSDQEFKVWVGDRIAQLIIEPYAEVTPTQATTLGSTVRGAFGFSSTGLPSLSNPMSAFSSIIRYLSADTRNSTSFSTYIKSDSKEFPAEMLIDSGATISLVSEEFVKANSLKIIKTSTTTLLRNADGSLNSCITHSLPLSLFLDGQFIPFSFYVAKIPMHTPFFLGHDFLIKFNPTIDWQTGQISSVHIPPLFSLPDYEKGDQVIGVDLESWAVRQVTTESTPPHLHSRIPSLPSAPSTFQKNTVNSSQFSKKKASINFLDTALETMQLSLSQAPSLEIAKSITSPLPNKRLSKNS